VSLLQGEIKLSECKPLKGEHSKNLERLKQKIGEIMLKSLGWEWPLVLESLDITEIFVTLQK